MFRLTMPYLCFHFAALPLRLVSSVSKLCCTSVCFWQDDDEDEKDKGETAADGAAKTKKKKKKKKKAAEEAVGQVTANDNTETPWVTK